MYNQHTEYLLGRRWYRHLKAEKEGLYAHETLQGRELIVCLMMSPTTPNGKERKFFSAFRDYLEFHAYLQTVPEHYRCFNEIIPAHMPRKMYFDIDASIDGNTYDENRSLAWEAVGAVISSFVAVFPSVSVSDFLIYESDRYKDKASIHIVLNRWSFENKDATRHVYFKLIEYIEASGTWTNETTRLDVLIDHAVYSANQNMRILGTHKPMRSNTKRLVEVWTLDEKEIRVQRPEMEGLDLEIYDLSQSLVTFTPYCRPLYVEIEERYQKKHRPMERVLMDNLEVVEILQHLGAYLGYDPKTAFAIRDTLSHSILLDRIKPSFCPLCTRLRGTRTIHQNENAYLLLFPTEIRYQCWRAYDGERRVSDLVVVKSSSHENLPSSASEEEWTEASDLKSPSPRSTSPPLKFKYAMALTEKKQQNNAILRAIRTQGRPAFKKK